MSLFRLLIVDDEPLVRDGIRHGLSQLKEIEIAGEYASGKEAITAILSQKPDLVLLDVQLHDCTGLEVVEKIGPQNMPPVVFVTAYDEYAVKAFELNAVDYLLKPFDDTRLRNSIERAIERISLQKHGQLVEKLQALLETRTVKWPERIVVRDGERFDLIPVASIEWIESANNYVQLHCGARSYLLSESLTHLESRLDPVQFIRIHRGRIINVARVLGVRTMLSSTYEVELRSGTRLTTGRQYKDMVQMRLLR
jgi:two-component system, LytTR family, response regulator